MVSILDNNALDDFIDTAEMDGDGFEVQRVHQNHAFLVEATTHKSIQSLSFSAFKHEQLSIPRKPVWNKNMTAEEVDRNEKNAFLQWRREIAAIEQSNDYNKKVTPFEKNLEVWRQLWRVCERSDLVIQIVDARNPLLYYTRDLMRYVSELNPPKKMILLVNKADFLTEYQRLVWAQYFNAIGVRFAFYSAHIEQSKLDAFGLVEDFEDSDVNEAEILWLAKDLVENYAVNAGETKTESILFDPSVLEGYLANERAAAEEAAAAQAATERARPQTIPEEQDEEEEEEEGSDGDSPDSESDDGVSPRSILRPPPTPSPFTYKDDTAAPEAAAAKGTGLPVSPEDADGEAEDLEDDENFAAYVQKTQARKLRGDSLVDDADDDEEQEDSDNEGDEHSGDDEEVSQTSAEVRQAASTTPAVPTSLEQRRARLLTRGELLLLLETVAHELELEPQPRHEGRVCIGLVGYPNVGKSSCINTLLGVSKNQHGELRCFSLLIYVAAGDVSSSPVLSHCYRDLYRFGPSSRGVYYLPG
jgi:ribosome biogenesis GTPase A